MEAIAHSANRFGENQSLTEHLNNVAQLASAFASTFRATEAGRRAGLWHDLGKLAPEFQARLRGSQERFDHRSIGARLATELHEDLIAFAVAGHHGGIPDRAELKNLLQQPISPEIRQCISKDYFAQDEAAVSLPPFVSTPLSTEFFIRMLFSALVDADFLDTERHFNPEKAELRSVDTDMEQFFGKLQESQREFSSERSLDKIRGRIYSDALRAADVEQGFFSLTAPTGSGKTRAAIAFALRHCLRHGLKRIIVVIPYLNIIDQTVDTYRTIFGTQEVIEHHSAVDPDEETLWSRLASENWDAPIIVTTSVQFFESLHANKPSRCRKLHNIASSVVILDEVQTLPPKLLAPTLDLMKELARNYRVSFLFSTATQPAFQERPDFDDIHEIVNDPSALFDLLQRVEFELPSEQKSSWEEIAARVQSEPSALVVLNTKKDARKLFDMFQSSPNAVFLSTDLCAAHRRTVLKDVKRRLSQGEPCYLIATQLVEVGVDIDFPVVFRALGPLDSIVQAAGRCNREGKSRLGKVVIFDPLIGGCPDGAYRCGTEEARNLLSHAKPQDLHNPNLYQQYFQLLYQDIELDAREILNLRRTFQFRKTAQRFRLIEEETKPVIVPYAQGKELINVVRRQYEQRLLTREVFRNIQPYTVSLRRRQFEEALQGGLCSEIAPGLDLYEWHGKKYDKQLGLIMEGQTAEEMVV